MFPTNAAGMCHAYHTKGLNDRVEPVLIEAPRRESTGENAVCIRAGFPETLVKISGVWSV